MCTSRSQGPIDLGVRIPRPVLLVLTVGERAVGRGHPRFALNLRPCQTLGHWPARNAKPAGEAFDLDLIDMSLPAEHRLRGTYTYRLAPDGKDEY